MNCEYVWKVVGEGTGQLEWTMSPWRAQGNSDLLTNAEDLKKWLAVALVAGMGSFGAGEGVGEEKGWRANSTS